MKRCMKCLIPETQESITYDDQGVCNVCNQHVVKNEQIDWAKRKEEFKELISQYKGKYDYDCIIPFSGGKDSTFTLYALVKEFGLKPLVVQFDHGFMRPKMIRQNEKTLKKMGVDFLTFKPNWQIVKKLMLESLKRKGDFCWHCHTGIFSYPMQVAIKYNVPLIIWGEPSAEYTSYYSYDDKEEVDERRFNRFVNLGMTAEDMIGFLDDSVTERDLYPFTYPKLKDLKRIKYRSICLGSYIPWDVKKQSKLIMDEIGWEGNVVEGVPEEYNYEKVECMYQGIRDYLKYIKRGFSRMTHLVSIDLRNKRLSVEDAKKLIDEYEGKRPASLDFFLEALEMTEKEFMEIAISHEVAPHKYDESKITPGKKLPDQDSWVKEK